MAFPGSFLQHLAPNSAFYKSAVRKHYNVCDVNSSGSGNATGKLCYTSLEYPPPRTCQDGESKTSNNDTGPG